MAISLPMIKSKILKNKIFATKIHIEFSAKIS